MKKFVFLFVAIAVFINVTAFAMPGDLAGYVYKTDIAAYINNYPIKSYNINNSTAILVEDLKQYGFDVLWDGNLRTVKITRNKAWEINPNPIFYRYSASDSGKYSCNYYDTDIVTYLDGEQITSFNIGGKTSIYLSSLKKYGNLYWDAQKREAHITIDSVKSRQYSALYTKYSSDFDAPELENASSPSGVKTGENTFSYNISDVSIKCFSDYADILKQCGFYYLEWKSSQDDSMYFTDDKTEIRIYYIGNDLFIALSEAQY